MLPNFLNAMIDHVTQLQSDRMYLVTQLQGDRIDHATQLLSAVIDHVTQLSECRDGSHYPTF